MNVLFEEHAGPQRAGGIEAATKGLVTALAGQGVVVTRRFTDAPQSIDAVPDCVHIHGIWSPTLARRFMHWRRLGVPCVVTVHGMLAPWAMAHKRLKKQVAWHIYQKRLLNLASALHATSDREAGDLRKLGLKPRIDIIPWGIEVAEERALNSKHEILNDREEEEKKALNSKHEILNGGEDEERNAPVCHSKSKIQNSKSSSLHRTALFVGRIYPVKGLPMLVEAWARVRPVGWEMKIVGPDEAGHQSEVEALIREAGLGADFEFAGALEGDALHQAYDNADLLILPSYTENFGMVVAEALAHGCPVIASQGSPWSGLLEHGCGWWPAVSSDGLADALQEATSLARDQLELMGVKGRLWMQRDFSWEQSAKKMRDVYESVAGNLEF